MKQNEVAKAVRDLSKQLLAIAEAIDLLGVDFPPVPPQALKLAAQGCCLMCGKKGEGYSRGLCEADLKATYRLIDSGETNWHKLIAAGKALPPGKTGRKRGERSQKILSEESLADNPQQVKTAKSSKRQKASPPPAKP